MPKVKAPKIEAMPRINTRIRWEQKAWIKERAKKLNLNEGEIFRKMLDRYIKLK